jgi:exonuclease III
MRGAGGFNGVTTYARKGLTLAADPAPLGDPALDGEGRCLLTDHGGFVVLNVYAHATGGEGAECAARRTAQLAFFHPNHPSHLLPSYPTVPAIASQPLPSPATPRIPCHPFASPPIPSHPRYASRLATKLAFFSALSALMRRLRDSGKRVVLCGDLNVAARGADVPWRQSLLPLAALRLQMSDGEETARAPPPAAEDAVGAAEAAANERADALAVPSAEGAAAPEPVAAAHAVAAAATATAVSELHEALGSAGRRALVAALPTGGARGVLACGRVFAHVQAVLGGGAGDGDEGAGASGDEASDAEGGEGDGVGVCRGEGGGEGGEGGGKAGAGGDGAAHDNTSSAPAPSSSGGSASAVGGSSTGGDTVGRAASVEASRTALRALSHWVGVSCSQKECVAWLSGLLERDGMVDSFAVLRPAARHRFTCWNQYTNQRYQNCGKRLDYFLIDASLSAYARAGAPLAEDDSEEGAKRAATANGRWLPAPTHGVLSGLQEARMTTHDTQFRAPHTGILCAPPTAPQLCTAPRHR